MPNWYNGPPGVQVPRTASHRTIFLQRSESFLAQGRIIDGSKARDPGNTPDVGVLRAGTVMGKITSGGKYANSVIGSSTLALTSSGTTLTADAATITEIARRIGASGTFKITGPPVASGTVRTLTATFSALASSTTATITALGVNEVQTVNFNIASSGGNVVLKIPKADGTFILTTPAAWNATDATYLAAIQAVLDVASGVANGIVVTAIPAVDTDLGFVLTFSGTGYAGLPAGGLVTVETLPTSSTSAQVTRTTTGVDGRFVTGSLIQPTDGSETPLTFIPDWQYGLWVMDEDGLSVTSVDFPQMPVSGVVDSSQLLPWPADTSLRTWLINALSTFAGGKFVFDHIF